MNADSTDIHRPLEKKRRENVFDTTTTLPRK